jgi:hypothetical protein
VARRSSLDIALQQVVRAERRVDEPGEGERFVRTGCVGVHGST